MRSRYYRQYALILQTGLRPGELIVLTWDAIDFEKRTLTVNMILEYRHKYVHVTDHSMESVIRLFKSGDNGV